MDTRPSPTSHLESDSGPFLAADLGERLNLEARLTAVTEEHLGFQRLVADIAARLASVDPDRVDEMVTDSLRQIVEALRLDRGIVWRRIDGEAIATPTHYWVRPSLPPPPERLPLSGAPWLFSKLSAGEPVWFSRVTELPDPSDREWLLQNGPRSGARFPLGSCDEGRSRSALAVSSMTEEREWPPAILERLRLVAAVIGQALVRKEAHGALRGALDEVQRLRDRLTDEPRGPRRDARSIRTSRLIVSESPAIKHALAQVDQVAPTPATVLLLGETGSGKEVFAQTIHDLSPRHQRPMIKVSCAAIPSALIESELFGRERGAYTGALSRQIGRFEAANQSTLFLDEIGDLPPEVQVKLLRVLQERVVERLGSTQPIKVDVRIIAATNRHLEKAVEDQTFREDLFYRLNVFPIVVPALRERVEDIPGLVWTFVDEFSKSFGKSITSISKDSIRDLQRHSWPGNVRELRNIIERAVIVATGPELEVSSPKAAIRVPQSAMRLVDLEVGHIRAVLESTNWRVRGSGGAAERLGLKPTTLESRMARFGIKRQSAV